MKDNIGKSVLIAAAAALLLLGIAWVGGYGMMGYGMAGFGMMGFGLLFMLIFWGLAIWVIVTLVSSSTEKKHDGMDAMTILKRRYASGELTKKEYEEMKKELGR